MNEPETTPIAAAPELEPERGFKIHDTLYEFPSTFKLTDPVLVAEISGLGWDPFIAAATGDDEWIEANGAPDEALVMVALLACAVWHKHPDWSRQAVQRFCQSIDETELEIVGADVPEVTPGEALAPVTATSTGATSESLPESDAPQASS